jgi:predicted RNase H-like HicB family nuclease
VTASNRYPAQVFWSKEDEGFIAVAPDLPGCAAFGESQEEALGELQDAIAAWIEAAQSAGNRIPEPSEPARDAEYSGKVLVRMPRELHGQLARLAKSENVSLNHYLVYLLTSASTRHKLEAVTHIAYGGAAGFAYGRVQATGFAHAGVSVINFGHMTTFGSTARSLEAGELALVGSGTTARREAQHG